MTAPILAAAFVLFLGLTFAAWRRYLWVAGRSRLEREDTCPYSLTDVFGGRRPAHAPHQEGVQWLHGDLEPLRGALSRSHGPADPPYRRVADLRRARRACRDRGCGAVSRSHRPGPGRRRRDAAGRLADRGRAPGDPEGGRDDPVSRHHAAGCAGDPHARGRATGRRPHARAGRLPRRTRPSTCWTLPEAKRRSAPPAWLDDPRERLAALFYTSGTTGRPKGVECPHAGYVNLALYLRGLLRSRSGPGRHLAHVVPRLRRQHLRDVQRLGVRLRGGAADEGADPVRPGSRSRPSRGRGHRALLPAGAAHHPHVDARAGSPLPASAATSFLRAKPSRAALVEPMDRVRDGRSSTPTAPPKRAPTRADRACGRGSPSPSALRFPNVTYVLLEVDELRPVPHGEDGELCIGGVHLARGYRNLPAETAEKFITHPRFGRLYRTGDRCRIDIRTQRVQFLGRIDAQLKVRGHRVEVQPVEDLLQTQFAEIEAAVLDYQSQELVAFVTAPSVRAAENPVVAPAPAEWSRPGPREPGAAASRAFGSDADLPGRAVLARARSPGRSTASACPISLGCKRTPLRRRKRALVSHRGARAARRDIEAGAQPGSASVLAICREVIDPALGWDDVFADHGGHSILIAELTARLQDGGMEGDRPGSAQRLRHGEEGRRSPTRAPAGL